MTTRFILVRHATCAPTASVLLGLALDLPLDLRGEQQARRLMQHFARMECTHVEASPRLRAQQTAHAIAAASGCDVITSEALDEVDFGDWSGRTFAELESDARWRRWNTQRGSARTPAGETMKHVQRRIVDHLHALRASHPNGVVALITHAELIRAALMHCLHASLDDYWRYIIDPASLTTLDVSCQGAFAVRGVNELVWSHEAAA